MNTIGMVGIVIIVVVAALGSLHGSIRSIISFLGVWVAFFVTDQLVARQMAAAMADGTEIISTAANASRYLWTFIGVWGGMTIGGFLLYGATRMHLVDSFEGVIGFVFGLLIGWGLARFMMSYIVFYKPASPSYMQVLDESSIAYGIYSVSPYQDIMNNSTVYQLRHPSF